MSDHLEELTRLARECGMTHSPWRLSSCEDWSEPSNKLYVTCGCDIVVEPSTWPADDGKDRMPYIAACDPQKVLPLLEELARLREYVDEVAGLDCEQYTKHLSKGPCGTCMTCRARNALSAGDKHG